MIITGIIVSLMNIFKFFINTILEQTPKEEIESIVSEIPTYINTIIGISTQAINFLHFIIGDTLAVIVPVVITLLAFKYLIMPIANLVLRVLPFVDI